MSFFCHFISVLSAICTPLAAGELFVFHLERFPRMGLFACANQVLGQLALFEEGKLPSLQVDFGISGLYYDPKSGENWWNYYFEPISLGKGPFSKIKNSSVRDHQEGQKTWMRLTVQEKAALVKKFIHVKPEIQEKIDRFAADNFQGYVIGVHYRGTDKCKEVRLVPYETVFDAIEKAIPTDRPYRIFVATDEEPFLRQAQARFLGKIVSIQAHRTEGTQGIHFLHSHTYEIGEEAILDCLLLSKCDLLIRTTSTLSFWSTYFNPDMPVVWLKEKGLPTWIRVPEKS